MTNQGSVLRPARPAQREAEAATAAGAEAAVGEPRGTVLVVDDERDVHTFLRAALEDEGYQVVSAYDGAEGIAAMRRGAFDVVLLDLMMPNVSGWRFLEMYRQLPPPNTPVVVMSAIARSAGGLRSGGVADVIAKPFSIDHLLRTVQRLIGSQPTE